MRILFLAPTPYFSLRGTPIAVRRVLRFLSARGHEVELLTFPSGSDEAPPGVAIIRCGGALGSALGLEPVPLGPSWRKALLDLALFGGFVLHVLGARLRGRRFDCVHAVDESAFGCWLLRPLLGAPVVYDMDSSIEEQFAASRRWRSLTWLARWVERRTVSAADAVVAVAPGLVDRVRRIDPGKPVHLLPDRPPVTAAMIRAAAAGPGERFPDLPPPIVLYVGNLGAHQGVEELLRAFEAERAAGLHGSLAIAGRLDARAARLKTIGPNAEFLGELPPERLALAYARSDVLAAPRLGGANTPMKVYEYIAAGKPILATRIPGHRVLRDHPGVVWAEPGVDGLRAGLRAAVAAPARGAAAPRRPAAAEDETGGEPVLEQVYAAIAALGERRGPSARRR